MRTSDSDRNPVEVLADEFFQRRRRGETPTVEEYAAKYPELAAEIHDLFPALAIVEDLGDNLDAMADLAPGKVVAEDGERKQLGDYRIIREVGRGGMGVVYEAEQVSLGRKVALKVLPFAAMLDKRQLQRFRNEARAAASLRHPNIVQVHFVGCERAIHFYAMDFIEGQTLAELIRHLRRLEGPEGEVPEDAGKSGFDLADSLASGRFAPSQETPDPDSPTATYTHEQTPGAEAETSRGTQAAISTDRFTKSSAYFRSIAEIGEQVAEALDHAHENGVIHRDVKPSNVMLDNDDKPWVTDFGLARIETDATLTVSGDLLGTVRYMSPEQALAKRIMVDHRTDVYSLGATLYELLTLQPVFSGQDRQELLRQVAFEEPKAPRKLNKAIPAELEIIVTKSMAKNPAERYDTAQELADDLRRFLEDRPIRARRPTLVQRTAKWSRRHKPVVAAAVVLLVMATLGFASSTYFIAKEKARTEDALDQAREAEREEARQHSIAETRRLEAEKERRRAEQNYRTAREAVDRLFTRVAERLQDQPHMEQIRRELLEDALEFYQGFLKQRSDNPELKMETALAHRRAGEIQGLLGDWEKSLANHQASAEILTELNRLSPVNVDYRAHLARNHYYLAGALLKLGRFQEADAHIEAGIPMWEELVESHPGVPEYLEDFARLCKTGGTIKFFQHKDREHRKYVARWREMLGRLRKNFPNCPVEQQLLHKGPTYVLSPAKDLQTLMELEREIRERIKVLEEQIETQPDVPDHQKGLSDELVDLIIVLTAMDRFEELEPLSVRAIVLNEELVENHPGVLEYQIGLGWSRYNYGLFLYYMGREAEATEYFRAGIEIASKVLENHPNTVRHYSHVVGMLTICPAPQFREPERAVQLATTQVQIGGSEWLELALAQVRAGQYEEALASCKKAEKGYIVNAHAAALIKAIAEWHVRNKEEAKREFIQVTTTIDDYPGHHKWRTSLEFRLLRREIEEMMGIERDETAPTTQGGGKNEQGGEEEEDQQPPSSVVN
jgi:eukaryotic-like serine/threonine-protein kinase